MEIAGIPVRDVIIGVSVIVAVYLAVTMLRLMRLGGRKRDDIPEALPPVIDAAADDDDDDDDEDIGEAPNLTYSRPVAPPPPQPQPQPAQAPRAPSFDAELGRTQVEREVRMLREEVAALRDEVADLKAASRVSPQYADAMALAQRGLTAQDVADRCGISLAEAELVWALARGPQDMEQEDEYGGEPGRNPSGR